MFADDDAQERDGMRSNGGSLTRGTQGIVDRNDVPARNSALNHFETRKRLEFLASANTTRSSIRTSDGFVPLIYFYRICSSISHYAFRVPGLAWSANRRP